MINGNETRNWAVLDSGNQLYRGKQQRRRGSKRGVQPGTRIKRATSTVLSLNYLLPIRTTFTTTRKLFQTVNWSSITYCSWREIEDISYVESDYIIYFRLVFTVIMYWLVSFTFYTTICPSHFSYPASEARLILTSSPKQNASLSLSLSISSRRNRFSFLYFLYIISILSCAHLFCCRANIMVLFTLKVALYVFSFRAIWGSTPTHTFSSAPLSCFPFPGLNFTRIHVDPVVEITLRDIWSRSRTFHFAFSRLLINKSIQCQKMDRRANIDSRILNLYNNSAVFAIEFLFLFYI